MSFFSELGDANGVNIKHIEHLSRRILVSKYWTRYVRLIEVIAPHDSAYWLIEVVDIGAGRHATEYPRGTYEEARKIFDFQTEFKVPCIRSPLEFGR